MKYLTHLFLVFILMCFQNCSTEIVNPTSNVGLNFAPYNAAASSKITTQSVNSLSICIRYIRFKANESENVEPIEVNIGELALSPAGTAVADMDVPNGNYSRIEIELKADFCTSNQTLQMTNDNGSFSTNEDIKMAFDGDISVENGELDLDLYIQTIISSLQNVTADEDIRDAVEAVTGSF